MVKKIPLTDWRRQGQENYLKNKTLSKRDYFVLKDDWEHDHCEFCGDKFSLKKKDLNKGYSTLDAYYWICENCYRDFQCEFEWKVR